MLEASILTITAMVGHVEVRGRLPGRILEGSRAKPFVPRSIIQHDSSVLEPNRKLTVLHGRGRGGGGLRQAACVCTCMH